jgi:beta-lactamase regulating signal transducer with metallopeptidase domain
MPPLGLWIPYAIAIGGAVALVAAAVERLRTTTQRSTRHVWLAALVAAPVLALVLPALAAGSAAGTPIVAIGDAGGIASPGGVAGIDGSPATTATSPDATRVTRVLALADRLERPLAIAWIATSVLLLATLAIAWARTARRTAEAPLTLVGTERVHLDDRLGPAAVVARRGAIVVPRWALDLEPALLALLVRHEREHLRARDPVALLAALVVVALVPWSPAAWWMCRRHRLAIEVDCDRRTIGDDPVAGARYASLLLLAAARPRHPRPAAAFVAPAMASHLARRITMLTTPTPLSRRRALALAAGTIVAAATLGFALPRPALRATPPAEFAGIYLITAPELPRATMLAPDREFTYLRLAADGRSRYENVTVEVDGQQVAPRVDVTRWSETPWRVEPATGAAQARLCWETPARTPNCSAVRRDATTGDLTLLETNGRSVVLRRVVR